MRTVMNAIFVAKRAYATLPLFEFMRDETLTPRERLSFFPCMAPFILDFGDLNKYVMRDESSRDPHQLLVNKHTYEDCRDIAALAAAYGFGLARNHPFVDGNKRAAFLAVGVFLALNGQRLTATPVEAIEAVLALAAGKMDEVQFGDWIRRNLRPTT